MRPDPNTPRRCNGPRDKSVGPFGNTSRYRCTNTASVQGRAFDREGHRVGVLYLCDAHLPAGDLGVSTPDGWYWQFEDLPIGRKFNRVRLLSDFYGEPRV